MTFLLFLASKISTFFNALCQLKKFWGVPKTFLFQSKVKGPLFLSDFLLFLAPNKGKEFFGDQPFENVYSFCLENFLKRRGLTMVLFLWGL